MFELTVPDLYHVVEISQQVRSVDVIDINMILHTLFTMFVNLKTGCEAIGRQHKKEGCWNTSTVEGISHLVIQKLRCRSPFALTKFLKRICIKKI